MAATPAASRCRAGSRNPTDDGSWKANAYIVKYTMDLWNNYTWDTVDPIYGDQFHQHDDRVYGGGGASRTFDGTFGGLPTETVFGVQSRYDDIITALNYSYQRQILSPYIDDHVGEGNAAIYAESTVHWTDWLRTIFGWRGDYYAASVDSMLQPANSGNVKEAHRQPEIQNGRSDRSTKPNFLSAPAWATTATTRAAPRLPKCPAIRRHRRVRRHFWCAREGAEIGVRTKAVPGLDSSVSLFYLHQDSELFFDGDTGDTTAGTAQPAHRRRVHQRLPPGLLAACRRQPGAVARPVPRLRHDARGALPIARRLSAGADRQRAGQLRLQRAMDDRRRRASRSAKRPAGSARCAGAISARGR